MVFCLAFPILATDDEILPSQTCLVPDERLIGLYVSILASNGEEIHGGRVGMAMSFPFYWFRNALLDDMCTAISGRT